MQRPATSKTKIELASFMRPVNAAADVGRDVPDADVADLHVMDGGAVLPGSSRAARA
jgi:hypothetical protein